VSPTAAEVLAIMTATVALGFNIKRPQYEAKRMLRLGGRAEVAISLPLQSALSRALPFQKSRRLWSKP
jgi:hypothetical protein